jgi:hypothetical protein
MKPRTTITADQQAEPMLETQEETVVENVSDSNEITMLLMELEKYGIDEDKFTSFKDRYGNIYVSSIHENGNVIFLWKKLSRGEYKQIAESGAMSKDMSYQDAVLRKCLLAPKPDQAFLSSSDAGVVPTLFSQIMYQSGFVPEHMALANIVEI